MKSHLVAAPVGRGVVLGLMVCLTLWIVPRATAQAESGKQDAGWVSEHVGLDLLPVAYVVRHGRLAVGGPVNMTPAGFTATTYRLYPNLTYGLTGRTEAMLGVTGAERRGPGGEATFYMLGLQHVLLPETGKLPAVSLGGYGFLGPHDDCRGGAVYLVASRQLTPHAYPRGVFAHAGVEFQGFSDDRSRGAAQPFVGANYVWSRRVRFSTEFRPRMPWERAHLYSVRTVVLLTRSIGVSGGLRNNGYQTHPFIGLQID